MTQEPLSARLANCPPGQERELLEELYHIVSGHPLANGIVSEPDTHVRKQAQIFAARLDCGAYLSAVEMLVPEGAFFAAATTEERAIASLAVTINENVPVHHAFTPALALASAIAWTMEQATPEVAE